VIAYVLFVAVMPASAQPAGKQAEELYDRGRALIAAGKTAEACAAFEQSQHLEPAVTTLIALATCRERLGQLATAWKLFLEAAQQTRSASDDRSMQLHGIALERAAKLKPRVSTLTIRVPITSKIDGLEILRDQERIPTEEWNRTLPVDGGTFTISARVRGASDWSTRVTLAPEADAKTVDIPDLRGILAHSSNNVHAVGTAIPTDSKNIRLPKKRNLAPWLVGGGGAVLAIGGGVLIAIDEDEVQHGTVVPSYRNTWAGGLVLTATGAVAVTASVVWLIMARKESVIAPVVSYQDGARVGIAGRF